ncbi:MAG: monovalent cation/H(+) antiporter subunit G [Chloroflexia bacterium]|nr:monovalent cation/H(+) antiporter subunit G [Chloroflexia bacterium]
MAAWLADLLVLAGVGVMTVGVVGPLRMPDVYTKLHAASKAVFRGVCVLAVASFASGDPAIVGRVALITVLLLLTMPVAAHVIGQAAYRTGEPMRSPAAIDETGVLRPAPPNAEGDGDRRERPPGAG